MEQTVDQNPVLNMLERPAFLVREGRIIDANGAALQCFLTPGLELGPLLRTGLEELESIGQDTLCLSLLVAGQPRNAVARCDESGSLLFLLDDPEDGESFRALALAAQQLRKPLTEAMGAAALFQEDWESEDPDQTRYMAQINRGLYRILRQVTNMTELGQMNSGVLPRKETTEAAAFFGEIFEKASVLAREAQKEVTFEVPQKQIFISADQTRVERAVYNLLSNALRFTPRGGRIHLSLSETRRHVVIRVQDSGEGLSRAVRDTLFARYRREPGLEDERNGMGLGLQLVRRVAALHGGTLMVGPGKEGGTVAAMTLEKKQPGEQSLRSPILRVDYTGERDHALVELSGELPWNLYEEL